MRTKNNKSTLWLALCLFAFLGFSFFYYNIAEAAFISNSSSSSPNTASEELVSQLNWVASNDPHNICHGFFIEPQLDATGAPILPAKQSLTSITADSGTFSQKSTTVLNGNVIVLQPGRRLEADHAVIYPAANGKYKALTLTGNVHAYEPGQLLIADSAYFNLLKKTGILNNVKYRVLLVPNSQIQNHLTPLDNTQQRLNGPVAWGRAKQAVQTKVGHTAYSEVSYSTCEPDAAEWVMIASKMNLNRETEYGNAHNARLLYHGIPIFYTPYWSFPLTKKRKTGFLLPLYGNTSISGLEVGLPFYWNINPNHDDTITPIFYSKRGVLFDNEFRYLTRSTYGTFNADFIPNDREFKSFQETAAKNPKKYPHDLNELVEESPNRYSLNWNNKTQFNPHWSSLIDYTHISDAYFLQDFGGVPNQIRMNQLLQEGLVQYIDTHWVFTGLLEGYQTLHPVNRQPLLNAYNALPELSLNGTFPYIWKNLGFTLQSQATYFTRSPSLGLTNITGGRAEVRPGLNYPLTWVWGYFDPQIQFDSTNYSLRDQPSSLENIPGLQILPLSFPFESPISRNLPIFNIHSGLYFDRDVNMCHKSYDQTLEPELFYLYVPYTDQNSIPVFDSGVIPFDYSQLFNTNRFSGLDRIGDANQISYALTTRFINNQTGEEKFHFNIGQIFYFEEHKVQLCNTPGCSDALTGLGATSDDERVSPIAAAAAYHFNPVWSLNGGYVWDPTFHESITGTAYFSCSPAVNTIFDVGYSFLRNGNIAANVPLGSSENNLNQVGVSTSWPIHDRWSALGIFNYNISQDHPQTYLGGLEYDSCCIDMRFLGGQVFSNINQVGKFTRQNAFYFQIMFKGLGTIGDNTLSRLVSSGIRGYVDPFSTSNYGLR